MSLPNFDANNPYQSPVVESPAVAPPLGLAGPAVIKLLRSFRAQIHALGVFWIVIGGLSIGLGVLIVLAASDGDGANPADVLVGSLVIFGGFGMTWVILGVLTCLKQMWAVYVGLVLSYIGLVLQVLSLGICGVIILLVVVFQAHRVISWARFLQRVGVPLHATPRQIALRSPAPETLAPTQFVPPDWIK